MESTHRTAFVRGRGSVRKQGAARAAGARRRTAADLARAPSCPSPTAAQPPLRPLGGGCHPMLRRDDARAFAGLKVWVINFSNSQRLFAHTSATRSANF